MPIISYIFLFSTHHLRAFLSLPRRMNDLFIGDYHWWFALKCVTVSRLIKWKQNEKFLHQPQLLDFLSLSHSLGSLMFLQCVCNQYFHARLSQQFCLHGLWESDELLYLHEVFIGRFYWEKIKFVEIFKENKFNYRKCVIFLIQNYLKFCFNKNRAHALQMIKIQPLSFSWFFLFFFMPRYNNNNFSLSLDKQKFFFI